MRISTANASAEEAAAARAAHGDELGDGLPDDFVKVSVADDGIGMEQATIDRVFEPFFSTKRKGEGTGLGLAMVHGIVSQHHGRISVTSAPGEGTRVEFYLPASEMRADSIVPEAPRVVELQGNETVLLVEDDEMVRDFAGRVLESYGYHVLATADGQEALEVAARFEGPIELLVTDVVMPNLSGPDLWRELGQLRPELRVLYISGYPDEELGHHGVLTEGIHFLPKPFKVEQLAEKVREALLGQ
jgi:CheY-like chemotaxis protein